MLLAFAVVPHKFYRHQEAFLHVNLCGNCIQSGASLPLCWQLNALQPLSSTCSALVAICSCKRSKMLIDISNRAFRLHALQCSVADRIHARQGNKAT